MWFATNTGVFQKYDGIRWTTYKVADGLIGGITSNHITQAQDGAMWFTAAGGIHRLDPSVQTEQEAWTHFDKAHFHEVGFDSTRTPSSTTSWGAKDGAVWFAMRWELADSSRIGGIARYQNGQWEKIRGPASLPNPSVRRIYETRDGAIYFLVDDNGVLRFHNGIWTHITAADGFGGPEAIAMLEAADGSLYFTHFEHGISRYHNGEWITYSDFKHRAIGLWQTHDGVIWASSFNAQFYRFENNRWQTLDRSTRFGSVPWTVPARDGSVWFWDAGGNHEKVQRFNPHHTWANYTYPGGLSGGFETDNGSVWFHTTKQAVQLKNATWLAYGPQDGFLDGDVYGLHKTSRALWFIGTHQNQHAVARYDGSMWRIFTTADGLIDEVYKPRRLQKDYPIDFTFLKTIVEKRDGSIWFLGKHEGGAAACRWDGDTFTRYTTANGLVGEWVNVAYEASDGSMWFGTYRVGVTSSEVGRGLYRFDGSGFTRFTENEGLSNGLIIDIAEWPKGTLWVGTALGLDRADLSAEEITWQSKTDFSFSDVPKPRNFLPTPDALWFGFLPNRNAGIMRYDGKKWTSFSENNRLVSNDVSHIVQNVDGTLWFAGGKGINRFDGEDWIQWTAEDGLRLGWLFPMIYPTRNGGVWVDDSAGHVSHLPNWPESEKPETSLDPTTDLVSSAGNILLKWSGKDMWDQTPPDQMRYRWRLNNNPWSNWSNRADVTLTALSAGSHQFEVQSKNRLSVVDASPAVHAFVVETAWWQNPYVMGLAIFLIGLAGVQTTRLIQRERNLSESNAALSSANIELHAANIELQRDRAVARIRAEVQSMDEAEDFEKILGLVTEDLKSVGLNFDNCEIDLLNEPVDEPTMAHFESNGFRYATYTLNPQGNVTTEIYNLVAPFPTVIRQTIDRFIAGEPWFGRSDDLSLVEVGAGSYGRLRLTSSTRDMFTNDEVTTLREFTNAIALGYARYLDIRTIQEQTERKSAFLASMSHELRTPMNVIKGFTNLVLRRAGDVLPERQKENLQKVDQASDHLLAMINDLLDLSKIEAGRMDVNVSTFEVEKLVSSCVSTVSPLVQDGVVLNYDVQSEIDEAHTDEARLRQMVINLTSNAIKFTPSGRIDVKAKKENDQLVLSVSDTGKGIPEDEFSTIFDEYRQVKGSDSMVQKGTGLGLLITKKFAELLGGTIRVDSKEGVGSTFTVKIPLNYKIE